VPNDIPRTLKVLWGLEERRTRGPQPALSLERIVAAAIEIADRDGLPALSMARLAERLGSAPMSLYRHVAGKDELLVFMQDAAPGEPPELPAGWRAGLDAWARALQAVYYRHPWILQASAGRPPLEPGQLAWLDRGLSAFDGTPLSSRERLQAVMATLYYVRGEAQIFAVLLAGDSDMSDVPGGASRSLGPVESAGSDPGRPSDSPGSAGSSVRSAGSDNSARRSAGSDGSSERSAGSAGSGGRSVGSDDSGGSSGSGGFAAPVAADGYGEIISALVTADRFPALAAVIADGLFKPDAEDVTFDAGLARLLDGIELLVSTHG
jgi:AcrR family transcriptional regulator